MASRSSDTGASAVVRNLAQPGRTDQESINADSSSVPRDLGLGLDKVPGLTMSP